MAIRWCVSKLIPFLAATAYSGSSSATTTTTNDLTPEEKDLAGSALAGWRLLGLAPSSRHLRQSSESINNATIYAKMFVRNFLSEDLSDGVGAVYGGNGSPLEVPSTVVAGSEAAFLATAAGNSAGISGTASWRIGDGRETPTHVVIMWSVPWSMVFRTNYLAVGLRSSETYDSNETFEQMYAEEPSWFARIDAGKADIMARSGNILTYGQTFPYYAKSFTPTYRVSVVSTDERRNARLSLKKSVNMTSEVSQDQLQPPPAASTFWLCLLVFSTLLISSLLVSLLCWLIKGEMAKNEEDPFVGDDEEKEIEEELFRLCEECNRSKNLNVLIPFS